MRKDKLYEFIENPICTKCGNSDIRWNYHSPVEKGDIFRYDVSSFSINKYVLKEHIFLHCRRCNYEWLMKIKEKELVNEK